MKQERKTNNEYWVVNISIGLNNTLQGITNKFRLTKIKSSGSSSGIDYFDSDDKIFSLVVTTTNRLIVNWQTGSGVPPGIFASHYNYGNPYTNTDYGWTINQGGLEMSQRLDLVGPTYAYGIYMYGPGGGLTSIYSFNAINGGVSYKLKDTLTNSYINFNIYSLTLIGGAEDQYYISENYNQTPNPKVLGVSQLRSVLSNNFLLDPNALLCSPTQGPIPC